MRKCPKCETLNGDASKICINCQTVLEEAKINNSYTNYEIKQEKNKMHEENIKKFEYWWIVIDVVISAIFLLAFFAKK